MATENPIFIGTAEVADLYGRSPQAMRKAAAKCYAGGTWRGARLIVRVVKGRGGRSGDQYEVLLDSLPPELRERWHAEHPAAQLPAPLTSRAKAPVLRRRQRADKGRRRVAISRQVDRLLAEHLDEAAARKAVAHLIRRARSYVAAGYTARQAAKHLTVELIGLLRRAGCDLPDQQLKRLCRVRHSWVARQAWKHRILHVRDRNAKRYADGQPCIRRDCSTLAPNDLWFGDVWPVDMYMEREDGTTQPVRLIAWLDARTNRLAGHLLFPEKGTGVRMEHVAASFAYTCLEWGMPKTLYIDNGGEYNFAEALADGMALVKADGDDRRTIVRALPFNGPAKGQLESAFRGLGYSYLAPVTGSIPGDRTTKRTECVGRPPRSFPGTRRDLWNVVQQKIAERNASPREGYGGLSPNEVLAQEIEAGWRRIKTDMATLQAAFAREYQRTLRQGSFSLGGRLFTHDELCRRRYLEKVTVRVPIFGDRRPGVYEQGGAFVCIADEETAYHPLDVEGARESARRKRLANQGVAALRADVDPIDHAAETAAFLALNPAPEIPEPAGTLGLAPELARDAAGRRRLGAQLRTDKEARERAERERWADIMDRLLAEAS